LILQLQATNSLQPSGEQEVPTEVLSTGQDGENSKKLPPTTTEDSGGGKVAIFT